MLTSRDTATQQQVPDPSKFPDGMAALAEEVHNMGFKIGIYRWVTPGSVYANSHQHTAMLVQLRVLASPADSDTKLSTRLRTIHGVSTVRVLD